MRRLTFISLEVVLMLDRKADELVDLITKSRTVLSSFAKAKTAKLGKSQISIRKYPSDGLHCRIQN